MAKTTVTEVAEIQIGPDSLRGFLGVPGGVRSVVIFAHGSGSGRLSPRNNYVAAALREAGFATLLLDLLTPDEENDRRNVFDIDLLASRLTLATQWVAENQSTTDLRPCYFGASTGTGAALRAAALGNSRVAAIVSRGGRPDLAFNVLPLVRAPTLLLVGSLDGVVIEMNQRAYDALSCEKRLIIVKGASHLFEEPGTLDEVIRQTIAWFRNHLLAPESRE
jgi:putative phosphoribosyl transferase